MPGIYCSVPMCGNNSLKNTENITFHRFPLHKEDMLRKWMRCICRPYWIPTKNSRICSAHFEDNCFSGVNAVGNRHLHEDACPSKFNPTYMEMQKVFTDNIREEMNTSCTEGTKKKVRKKIRVNVVYKTEEESRAMQDSSKVKNEAFLYGDAVLLTVDCDPSMYPNGIVQSDTDEGNPQHSQIVPHTRNLKRKPGSYTGEIPSSDFQWSDDEDKVPMRNKKKRTADKDVPKKKRGRPRKNPQVVKPPNKLQKMEEMFGAQIVAAKVEQDTQEENDCSSNLPCKHYIELIEEKALSHMLNRKNSELESKLEDVLHINRLLEAVLVRNGIDISDINDFDTKFDVSAIKQECPDTAIKQECPDSAIDNEMTGSELDVYESDDDNSELNVQENADTSELNVQESNVDSEINIDKTIDGKFNVDVSVTGTDVQKSNIDNSELNVYSKNSVQESYTGSEHDIDESNIDSEVVVQESKNDREPNIDEITVQYNNIDRPSKPSVDKSNVESKLNVQERELSSEPVMEKNVHESSSDKSSELDVD